MEIYWKEKKEQERRLILFNKLLVAAKVKGGNYSKYIESRLDRNDLFAFWNDYEITDGQIKFIPHIKNGVFRQSYMSDYENFSGVYFIGDIKYDPLYGKMFYVKVGSSKNIGKRMKQYRTYNPAFFHHMCSLPTKYYHTAEDYCQNYLQSKIKFVPKYTAEWWIVDEETYWQMCKDFSNEETFSKIAKGIWD
jgi:hypothetical protein